MNKKFKIDSEKESNNYKTEPYNFLEKIVIPAAISILTSMLLTLSKKQL